MQASTPATPKKRSFQEASTLATPVRSPHPLADNLYTPVSPTPLPSAVAPLLPPPASLPPPPASLPSSSVPSPVFKRTVLFPVPLPSSSEERHHPPTKSRASASKKAHKKRMRSLRRERKWLENPSNNTGESSSKLKVEKCHNWVANRSLGKKVTAYLRFAERVGGTSPPPEFDEFGWVNVDFICKALSLEKSQLLSLFIWERNQGKSRWEWKDHGDSSCIRALNGHFVDLPKFWAHLTRVPVGTMAVHGTSFKNFHSILSDGLVPTKRWVHLVDVSGGEKSGREALTKYGRHPSQKGLWLWCLVKVTQDCDVRAIKKVGKHGGRVLLSRTAIPPTNIWCFDQNFQEHGKCSNLLWDVVQSHSQNTSA
eukprot:sb/3465879/